MNWFVKDQRKKTAASMSMVGEQRTHLGYGYNKVVLATQGDVHVLRLGLNATQNAMGALTKTV